MRTGPGAAVTNAWRNSGRACCPTATPGCSTTTRSPGSSRSRAWPTPAADGWKEQLAQALDYRGWLRLSLQYRPGAGSPWVVFDAARHAAKSGGEKVVLLSQPLFAAAVVAYDAAGPHAPRWVWLDEAMT